MQALRESLRPILRRYPNKAAKRKGGYYVRLCILPDGALYKSKRVEYGLDTRDESVAADRAALLVRSLLASGVGISSRLVYTR